MEQTLAREARDGGAPILLPITIDDYIFMGWKPSKAVEGELNGNDLVLLQKWVW